jgi:hypothetical protein
LKRESFSLTVKHTIEKMGGAQDDEENNYMDTKYKVGFWQIYLLGTVGGFPTIDDK